MYKFKNSLIALIGLVSLITVVTVMTPHIGYGSSGTAAPAPSTQNVNVVNTPTVKSQQDGVWNVGLASGSNVGIAGTLTVNAQQSGIWSVGINGTPTVGIDAANNTVKIDTASPVPVRDVDNPARQPFTAQFSVFIPNGYDHGLEDMSDVPAGKRVVIEHISALTRLPSGQKVEALVVLTIGSGQTYLGAELKTTIDGLDQFITSQPVRLYVDHVSSPPALRVVVYRDGVAGDGGSTVNINGYLVDVP
ncbi:MAG TPA: hypothetical protein VF899_04470 [Pyrinomonadaceae bacterium]